MLDGLGNISNMMKLIKDAGRLKEKLEEVQRGLAEKTVSASAGGGMVTVTASGAQEILHVQIEDAVVTEGDREMLEALVAAACNAALERSRELARQEIAQITGGLGINLPGII
jgi:DNA-binding YbaB/EbfC family protein